MENIKDIITQSVSPKLQELSCFLVDIKIDTNRRITLYIDHMQGVTVDMCTKVNRYLMNLPELENIFSRHGLDVSSPGLDLPLRHPLQFEKNIGKELEIILNDGFETKGKLLEASSENLLIETVNKNQSKEIEVNKKQIPFTAIKKAKLKITF